jgi:hypothetical protein
MSRTKNQAQLQVEALEDRQLMSVSQLWFSGNKLCVKTDNLSTTVHLSQVGSNVRISEVGTGRFWDYAASSVGKVEFQGGAGNDRFINYIYSMPVIAFGNGGNDYLEGYNGADQLIGGDGNDTLVGYGGNDSMWGGNGHDVLLGMAGNDQLVGDAGNDRLNGGIGNDSMWGGDGDDVIIAIDSFNGNDWMRGDAGRDIIWADPSDIVSTLESVDFVQRVSSFTNGADRTLDGDRIADPTAKSGHVYRRFAGNPLFSSSGPRYTDIRQGNLGDCWVLAGLGAIANDNPHRLRQYVVDFDDGTYGVRLGNNVYRVDDDLPVVSSSSTSPVYAQLGAQNSMWVAIVEKAYALYRTGANSYASIEGGWSVHVNQAFGSTSAGEKAISSYSNATALANDIYNRWVGFQAVTIGFAGGSIAAGAPLINSHMYTVISVTRNSSGVVTSIRLYNPWGVDGAGNDGSNDGLVTVTPAQLFGSTGRVNWGRV